MKNNSHTPIYKENKTDTLQFNIAFYIISCFLLYVIGQIIDVIFAPLKMLSKEETERRLAETVRQKITARKNRVFDDPNDPMNQFRLRFIDKKPEYKKDKNNNEMYNKWFQAWKNGKIIDSDLRWAPTAMDYDVMRHNFIQYMKIQYNLHKKAGLVQRILFLNTIHKYYPELSASMKGLINDLAYYENEIDIIEAERALKEEIQKYGLPVRAAEYLAEKDINPQTLRKEALFIKTNIEKGFSEEACICILKHNFNEGDLQTIEEGFKKNISEEILVPYIKEEITIDDVNEIIETLNDFTEMFGIDHMSEVLPWSNETRYEDLRRSEIKEHIMKNITNKLNTKVKHK